MYQRKRSLPELSTPISPSISPEKETVLEIRNTKPTPQKNIPIPEILSNFQDRQFSAKSLPNLTVINENPDKLSGRAGTVVSMEASSKNAKSKWFLHPKTVKKRRHRSKSIGSDTPENLIHGSFRQVMSKSDEAAPSSGKLTRRNASKELSFLELPNESINLQNPRHRLNLLNASKFQNMNDDQLASLIEIFKEGVTHCNTNKLIPKLCFRGDVAIDWIVDNTSITNRNDAIQFGQFLMHKKVFFSLERTDYPFKDKSSLYQFRHVHKDAKWLETEDNESLYYRIFRPPQSVQTKAVILFVHGLGDHSGRYIHLFNSWTQLGFLVYSYDHRGHGNSTGKRGHASSFQCFIDDLVAIFSLVQRDPDCSHIPLFIYARSLGAQIALSACLQKHGLDNFRGMIVTAPLIKFAKDVHFTVKSRLKKHLVPNRKTSYFTFMSPDDDISKDPANFSSYKADTLCHCTLSVSTGSAIIEAGTKLLQQARNFTLPILIVHGDADKVSSLLASVDFHALLGSKDKVLKIWPGLFHDVENEPEKDEVHQVVVDWVMERL